MSQLMPRPTDPSRTFWLRSWLLPAVATLLLALCLFSPAGQVLDTQLDSSNYGSYAFFTAKHFQYGAAVVPLAGPYGFVPYGNTYSGYLFGKRIILEALTKLILSALVVWFFLRSTRLCGLRWVWLLLVACVVPEIVDLPYSLAILLSGLCLAEYHPATSRRSLLVCCAVAGYLALLTLFKGTQTLLAVATFGLLFVQSLLDRNFRRLPWIIGSYVATLIILWVIAGQDLLNLPRYFSGVSDLAYGYNLAMGYDEPRPVFLVGAALTVTLQLLLGVCLLSRWRNPPALAGGLFLAGFNFAAWKHGFVRADEHVHIYFKYTLVAVPTLLLFLGRIPPAKESRVLRALAAALAVLACSLALWANAEKPWRAGFWFPAGLPARLTRTWQQLTAPAEARRQLDALLDARRIYYQLPQFQNLAGRGRIDFFGNEQAYLMLNRFNYWPRPMGGGTFSAYTPGLRARNTAFMLDANRRPEYFLANIQTIDQRFVAQNDAGTLLALLANYQPVESGSGLTLLRADPGPPQPPALRPLGSSSVAWNEPIGVPAVRPDEMVLVSLQLPPSFVGRLRAFFYKPPAVFMDVQGAGINLASDRKVIPNMFSDPVPLSPMIESNDDLLALYQAKPGKLARQLTLKTTEPGCFDPTGLKISFYAMARPAPAPPVPLRLIHSLVSTVPPFLVEAVTAPLMQEDDMVAQILAPPGRMGFDLKGDETTVLFTYGMHPFSYTRPTDGMNFVVDLVRPGQVTQQIFDQHLSPRDRPQDQGRHTVRLVLPPFTPGSKLYLRTTPGPANDGAWDLGYFTAIDFLRGPYLPAQFPGFAVLPSAISANMCGSYLDNNREIFLLHSPGSMTFRLNGGEKILRFTAGLLPGAYSNGGHSDGVEIIISLKKNGGSPTVLFQRIINPASNPADRGDQSFQVPLPAFPPGTELTLVVSPGPDGNYDWDWSYLSGFRID